MSRRKINVPQDIAGLVQDLAERRFDEPQVRAESPNVPAAVGRSYRCTIRKNAMKPKLLGRPLACTASLSKDGLKRLSLPDGSLVGRALKAAMAMSPCRWLHDANRRPALVVHLF
jgi:hypothetical protein